MKNRYNVKIEIIAILMQKSKPMDPGSRTEKQRVTRCANRLVVTPTAHGNDGERRNPQVLLPAGCSGSARRYDRHFSRYLQTALLN